MLVKVIEDNRRGYGFLIFGNLIHSRMHARHDNELKLNSGILQKKHVNLTNPEKD